MGHHPLEIETLLMIFKHAPRFVATSLNFYVAPICLPLRLVLCLVPAAVLTLDGKLARGYACRQAWHGLNATYIRQVASASETMGSSSPP